VGSSHQTSTALWVGNVSGKQQTRKIKVNGITASLLRNVIFKAIAKTIDAYGTFGGGTAFPTPGAQFLTGSPATVPTGLIGGTPEQAKAAIELAELTYADGGPIDSDLPVGQVASLNPGEGSSIPRGTTVTVYTSNGQAVQVPNEVGQDFAPATADLHSHGFNNVNQACEVATGPTDPQLGKVVSQVPAGGTAVNPSTAVTLTVRRLTC
jgi:hypothetical protein